MNLMAVLEGLLFIVGDEGLSIDKIQELLQTSEEETKQILAGLRDKYEAHHNVKITDEAINAAVELSTRYINDRFLPDKAIDLIDEAASRVRMKSYTEPESFKDIKDEIEKLGKEKEEAIRVQDFEKAANLRDKEKSKKKELEKAKMFWLNPTRSYIQSKDYNDYPCDTCGRRILKDVDIIKVGKKVKGGRPRKMFKFGAGIEELLCVSADLYNYFLDNGVNSEDFRPVYCGKEMQGYAFTPIEEYDVISSVYEYRICESCGREYALYDIPKGYHPEKFELRELIDFSAHDVYKTKVYYDREQRILISPKLFKLMKNYIKDNEYKAIF